MQILLGNECVDEVEMPQVPYEHPVSCKGSLDRQSRWKQDYVHGVFRLEVVEKRRGPEMQRQRFENCVKNFSVVTMWRRRQEPSAKRQVAKVGMEKFGRWKLTRLTARRSWTGDGVCQARN